MKKPALTLLLLLTVFPARGEDAPGLRPPAGPRAEKTGGLTVSLGFGSVTLPPGSLERPGAPTPGKPGRLLACNAGTFSLAYELSRDGGRTAARKVSVRVRNAARYFDEPTPRLREHEDMHQRINRAAASRLEKELAAWSSDAKDMKSAEASFRSAFRGGLEAVKALHRDWDANSVFVEEPKPPR